MRCTFLSANRLVLCGLLAVSVTSTGCRSGWHMPGMSKMAWSKKPSQETLAGNGPTMTGPTSPATTQTPSLIAKNTKAAKPGANALSNASPNPSLASNTSTTNPSGNSPYSSAQFNAAQPPKGASSGAAAAANGYAVGNAYASAPQAGNGYSTGPYSTYGQPNAAPNAYGQAGPANVAAASKNAYPGLSGATVQASTPATPVGYGAGDAAMPQIPAKQFYANNGAGDGGMYSMPNSAPAQMDVAKPNAYPTMPTVGGYNNMASAPSYTPVSTGAAMAMPSNAPSIPTNASLVGYAAASSPTPATTASYKPGSIQRSTGYDFSNAAGSSAASGAANTASGTSNPGYSMPTSATFSR